MEQVCGPNATFSRIAWIPTVKVTIMVPVLPRLIVRVCHDGQSSVSLTEGWFFNAVSFYIIKIELTLETVRGVVASYLPS